MNNAYESLGDIRVINIYLNFTRETFHIEIQDLGIGIPFENLDLVLKGFSTKHNGEGLGLSGAKRFIEAMNGKLMIKSSVNGGTTVTIHLNGITKPVWFPSTLKITRNASVVILDDDRSTHELWRHRLHILGIETYHFYNTELLLKWIDLSSAISDKMTYFIDYKIDDGTQSNGLDLLVTIGPQKGYLITSHAEQLSLQLDCKKEGVLLLPKKLIGDIDIFIENSEIIL